MGTTKRHCIIGAGFSGLTTARKLVELGELFDVYDKNTGIGGLWHTGAYNSAHLVSSKTNTQFEDFPMPAHYPDFPGKQQMQEYLATFADAFGITPHIYLGKTVTRVYPAPDYATTHDWLVDIEGEGTKRYGTVIVANGHLSGMSKPRTVNYLGKFDGELLQANQYVSAEPFRGQRVLVVGAGNTGCDIAVDSSYVAAKTHISMRDGKYFLPKTFMGTPISDLANPNATGSPLERWFERQFAKFLYWMTIGKASRYGLPEPQHRIFDKHPTINSQLPYQIKQGAIQARPEIKTFRGKQVEFIDGTCEAYDIIVLALGYHVNFPMLPHEDHLLDWEDGLPILFMNMAAPRYRGLFFNGLGQAQSGGGPLFQGGGDIVARMAAHDLRSEHGVMRDLQAHPALSKRQLVDRMDDTSHHGAVIRRTIRETLQLLDDVGSPDAPRLNPQQVIN